MQLFVFCFTNLGTESGTSQQLFDKNVLTTSQVFFLMKKTVKKMWFYIVKTKGIPAGVSFPVCVAMMIPAVRRHSAFFLDLINHNLRVHVSRYNHVITNVVNGSCLTE